MQEPRADVAAPTLVPTMLEQITLRPGDGVAYRVASSLVRACPRTRFFAMTREADVLVGDLFELDPEPSFVQYIDRMAEWHDLALLWAGWRVFLFLSGRPDQSPPADLPRWRADWYLPLTRLALASYQVQDGGRSARIIIHRTGPQAYAATVLDALGRPRGQVLGCASLAAALERARHDSLGALVVGSG